MSFFSSIVARLHRIATAGRRGLDSPGRPVLAAVVRRGDAYLVGLRPASKRHGGLWEFPGGKVRDGESWLEAAGRELEEELGVAVTGAGEPRFRRPDPASGLEIVFVDVVIEGEPRALEHEELRWVDAASLSALELAPADRAFAETLAGDRA
jgi:8-oxo-dGTP diphosphatase